MVSNLVSRVSLWVDCVAYVVVLSSCEVEVKLGAHSVEVDRGVASAWSKTRAVG